jgi:hypothetical protein
LSDLQNFVDQNATRAARLTAARSTAAGADRYGFGRAERGDGNCFDGKPARAAGNGVIGILVNTAGGA